MKISRIDHEVIHKEQKVFIINSLRSLRKKSLRTLRELFSSEFLKTKIVKYFYSLLFFSFLLLFIPVYLCAQNPDFQKRGDVRIMFYNAENFFDTIDDPHTNDNDFLPDSKLNWDKGCYYKKIKHIYQTIAAVGEISPPDIIGLAEIENRKVLNDLIYQSPLEKYNYKIIHKDSPDPRGIDVGLLYRADKVKYLHSAFFEIVFPGNTDKKTRDILYFKGLINSDTVHVFINHWPSRKGGQKRSEPFRNFVASVLKQKVDSLLKIDPKANIIITGDFNDQPDNKSLSIFIGALKISENTETESGNLYNLSWTLKEKCECGTYRLGVYWDMLDQFLVSGSLLENNNSLFTCKQCLRIGEFGFLLKEDEKYGGFKPFRTYAGPAYKGGFSDHLPIFLDLYFR
jgi:predicted extracellular nuclease